MSFTNTLLVYFFVVFATMMAFLLKRLNESRVSRIDRSRLKELRHEIQPRIFSLATLVYLLPVVAAGLGAHMGFGDFSGPVMLSVLGVQLAGNGFRIREALLAERFPERFIEVESFSCVLLGVTFTFGAAFLFVV